jgi:hypothetical protein
MDPWSVSRTTQYIPPIEGLYSHVIYATRQYSIYSTKNKIRIKSLTSRKLALPPTPAEARTEAAFVRRLVVAEPDVTVDAVDDVTRGERRDLRVGGAEDVGEGIDEGFEFVLSEPEDRVCE